MNSPTQSTWSRLRQYFFSEHWLRTVAAIFFIIFLAIAERGHYLKYGTFLNVDEFAQDFYSNYFAEFLGIFFTVLIIDRLNEIRENRREEQAEKVNLIGYLSSGDNANVSYAVGQLRARGWLTNGTLDRQYFRGTNLSDQDLSNASFRFSNLSRTNFEKAILTNANLTGANLSNCDLREADLQSAILVGVDLSETNLGDVQLTNADLSETKLIGAYSENKYRKSDRYLLDALKNVKLCNANLQGVVFTRLESVNFQAANLENARFARRTPTDTLRDALSALVSVDIDIRNCNFIKANLVSADFKWNRLSVVDFSSAKLTGTNFSGTVLIDVSFSNAKLENTNFTGARYTSTTTWPPGFDPKAAGARELRYDESTQTFDLFEDIPK